MQDSTLGRVPIPKECPDHGFYADSTFCPVCGQFMIEQPRCVCGRPMAGWEHYCRACGVARPAPGSAS
jgi:hypothetical protein